MKKIIIIALLFSAIYSTAQVGIGTTTPDASSELDIASTTKGALIPRMTQAQRNAIVAPATGLFIYQTDLTTGYYFFNGFVWQLISAGNNWSLSGNAGTAPATNQLGTNDNQSIVFKTNNSLAMQIETNGNASIGSLGFSDAKLSIQDDASNFYSNGFENNSLGVLTTGGPNGGWTVTNDPKFVYSGSFSAQSAMSYGFPTSGDLSTLSYTATLTTPGIISFAIRVSTRTASKFYFKIDGVIVNGGGAGFVGIWPWSMRSYPVTAGTHTFEWIYNGSAPVLSTGSYNDRVFVDDIKITLENPVLRVEDGTQANNYYLQTNATGNLKWVNPNASIVADDDWRFNTGSANSDPIYRGASVRLGASSGFARAGFLFDVYKNDNDYAEVGIGSTEYYSEGNGVLSFSHAIVPAVNNTASMGTNAKKFTRVYAVNGTIQTSDERDKEKILPLQYGLKELMQLKPVSYIWKEEKVGNTILADADKKLNLGFIAQELKKILPETVQDTYYSPDENDLTTYKKRKSETIGVSYSEIVPVIVKSTQEHQVIIDEIKVLLEKSKTNLKNFEK